MTDSDSTKTEGKGRPTPKRTKTTKSYVNPPPTNRKEAARQLRDKQAVERRAIRDGSKRGDEKAFLKRDQGPVRSQVRDIVDSQRSLGPVLLPFMLVVIASGFINQQVYAAAFLAMLAMIVVVGLDAIRLGRQISKGLTAKFPKVEGRRGHVFYGLQRTTLIRRFRVPPPKVSVGDAV